MAARILAVIFVFLLSGCFGGGEKITDFSNRSTVYGWVDVSGVRGNNLFSMSMRQYSPTTDKPYYFMGLKKFSGGYLFWHHGFAPAAYEFDKMQLQSCLGGMICSNTINEYQFGPFADSPGKTVVRRPGAHFVGNFTMRREGRANLFGPGQFSVVRTRGGPSQAAMLREILGTGPDGHPIIDQRIRAAM